MTRKDYELIAKGIRTARTAALSNMTPSQVLELVQVEIADLLLRDNASFNARKFHAACEDHEKDD